MSSLLRLSLVYAGFIVPMRLARRPVRMVQTWLVVAVAYYVLIRVGVVDVSL
ncbi:MAG: hypothetical protein IT196_15055 [Acidimicrobiales bacterium]|nr:hypothetical protein [Acidimicrobiales bacterium]